MASHKVVSYKQKKKLLKHLQDAAEKFKAIEEKLVSGAFLDPAEQAYYDANSGVDNEKIAWLQADIKVRSTFVFTVLQSLIYSADVF